MPLYDYRCSKCGEVKEVRHGFDDRFSEPCAVCGGELKRVISPAPILFKGSGFYVTDSRSPSASGESKSSESKTNETKSSESKTSDSKPSESPKSGESAA